MEDQQEHQNFAGKGSEKASKKMFLEWLHPVTKLVIKPGIKRT